MDCKGVAWWKVAAAVVIIVIVVGVGVWYLFANQQQQQIVAGEPIKVGIVLNLTGAMAPECIRARMLLTAVVTQINAEGGIFLEGDGAYHSVHLIFYDGESNTQRFVELATKMITEKEVHIMTTIGAPTAAVPTCIQAEKIGGIPLVMGLALDTMRDQALPSVPGNKFTWTWHFSWYSEKMGQYWAACLSKYKPQTNGKLGVLYTDDANGRQSEIYVIPKLKEIGFTIVHPGLVPPGTTDFTPVITKFKEEGVEVVIVNVSATEWIPFRRQTASFGFKPKLIGVGRCMKIPEAEALGRELAEGIMVECWWWYKYPYPQSKELKELWDRIAGDMPMTWAEGTTYARFQIMLEAVKKAGVLDRTAINNAMAKLDVMTPVGRAKFDPETHMCEHLITVGQFVYDTKTGKWDVNIVWAPEGSGITPEPAIFPLP
ncbi:MAG: ABC transporter substrate-binding protein [Candidatus Bathyarchaeia archaeon]